MEPLIHIENLYKSFGDLDVLNGFSLDLLDGENLVIVGRSGSGKSVLLKCIVRLLEPDAGTLQVLGQSVPALSQYEMDHLRTEVGFLFQGSALYDSMTVRENLEFPLRRHSFQLNHNEVDQMVLEALQNVGLEHTVDMMPADLSGGMRKRIALARTLILKPEIILYDEPTTGLDPITSQEISALINQIRDTYQTSSLVISHDMRCVRTVAHRIVMLIDGKCYAQGTYEELSQSNDPKISAFFD